MPYPHAGPIDFKMATLITLDISTDTASPGEMLSIKMQWSLETTDPLTATLRLVSPAEHRHNVSYTLVETEVALASSVSVEMELPGDLSRGLYLLQLRFSSPLSS